MEISCVLEQQEGSETLSVPQPGPAGWPAGVEPDDPPRPQGGRWVKGQSGNPAGRPPKRAHVAAFVANGLINRKTLALTDKLIELAWAGGVGDKRLLQHLHRHITPPRQELPIDVRLPPIETRADVCNAMRAVADAALNGTITSAQSLKLLRMLRELYCTL
jgi:hypothetical protein